MVAQKKNDIFQASVPLLSALKMNQAETFSRQLGDKRPYEHTPSRRRSSC